MKRESEVVRGGGEVINDESFSSKIPLRFAFRLLSLDFWRDDGVVDDVRAVDGVYWWHPLSMLVFVLKSMPVCGLR